MNKEQLLEKYFVFCDEHDLNPEYFVVGGGGAMVIHGLRAETKDIDVAVQRDVFEKLLAMAVDDTLKGHVAVLFGNHVADWDMPLGFNCHGWHDSGKPVIQVGDFEIHLDELDCQLVDGAGVQRIESILEMKKRFNRPKDQQDIVLLGGILNESYQSTMVDNVITYLELNPLMRNRPPRIIGAFLKLDHVVDPSEITLLEQNWFPATELIRLAGEVSDAEHDIDHAKSVASELLIGFKCFNEALSFD